MTINLFKDELKPTRNLAPYGIDNDQNTTITSEIAAIIGKSTPKGRKCQTQGQRKRYKLNRSYNTGNFSDINLNKLQISKFLQQVIL